jgi:ABC-2 type transport system permease protein
MGETIFRAMLNAVFGGLTVWWLVGAPQHPEGFLIAIPAILGAWILHFCINAMIGLSAFVVEDVSAFTWIYQKLAFIFGGMLIPLDFYPQWLQTLAKFLPFSSAIYGPARLFVTPSVELFVNVMSLQLAWILALTFVLVIVYRRGLTQLTVNGG